MNIYIVKNDSWLYGRFYKAGEKIHLSEKQAKYELLAGNLELYHDHDALDD
jgi:hypothetical protein